MVGVLRFGPCTLLPPYLFVFDGTVNLEVVQEDLYISSSLSPLAHGTAIQKEYKSKPG